MYRFLLFSLERHGRKGLRELKAIRRVNLKNDPHYFSLALFFLVLLSLTKEVNYHEP